MFNIVSTWNKRRRSKSLDQLNPWVYKTAELWQVKEKGAPLPLPPPRKRNCSMVFTLKEMEEATGRFRDKNLVGKGGFGRVYRGVLKDGQIVAVKKMDLPASKQADGEREFRVEIDILSRLDHPNLVTLIGYCADGKHRFVVYEFMPKGNLQDILNGIGDVRLDWGKRLRIALGAARGLAYLHSSTAVGVPVVHRDFKSSNILLTEHFEAKISDFGLAKLMPQDLDLYATTRVLDGEADSSERRVRLRRRPPGAAHRPPCHRSQPGASGPEPHRQDTSDGGRPEEVAQGGGQGHGQGLLHPGVDLHVRQSRRALRLLGERRPAGHAGVRQGASAHHVRQHEDMSVFWDRPRIVVAIFAWFDFNLGISTRG